MFGKNATVPSYKRWEKSCVYELNESFVVKAHRVANHSAAWICDSQHQQCTF